MKLKFENEGCDLFLLDIFPFSEVKVNINQSGEWRLDAFLDLVQVKLAYVLHLLLGFSEFTFSMLQL